MADFGFQGAWKAELGVIVEATITNAADTQVDIAQGLTFGGGEGVVAVITTAGNSSGYTTPSGSALTIGAPDLPNGVQAAGYVVSAAGAIDSAVITEQGSGYTSVPTVTAPDDGTQGTATLTAVTGGAQDGATYISLVITTTANTRIEIGGVSSATSFLITASDKFICTVASDRDIGLWGVTGTPTVTIQRVILA
jgi:hypothetical protein